MAALSRLSLLSWARMTARFGKKKFDFRIQIETNDVVYTVVV
jgi:hypothetical protein